MFGFPGTYPNVAEQSIFIRGYKNDDRALVISSKYGYIRNTNNYLIKYRTCSYDIRYRLLFFKYVLDFLIFSV